MSIEFILNQAELIIRLILAAGCGLAIGFERKNRRKEAGVRTHIIVALASCLMMEISKYGFSDSGDFDGARLAAQVVSGIGFLGAGMIFVHKNSIKGLTTAAGVWATSGIGMAVGAGMYVIGIVTTIIILIIQIVLHNHSIFLSHTNIETIKFTVEDTPSVIDFVNESLKKSDLGIESVSMIKLDDNLLKICVVVEIHYTFDMFAFTRQMCENPAVKSVCNEDADR